jgi:2-dehydropantoate 2-reductase
VPDVPAQPMKLLVYGAGVIGSIFAARMHDAGNDVSLLARGERLASLREHGLLLAEGDSPTIRTIPLPVVDTPADSYDLIAVFVRTHQVDAALEQLAQVKGDVLFALNWAAGPEPLAAGIGRERVLLSYPAFAGTMDGDVVRSRPGSLATRFVPMFIGEPDGSTTPRLQNLVRTLKSAGIRAKAEPRMDAWLKTHVAFEAPLGRAVRAAGGPVALAGDRGAIRDMIRDMRSNFAALPVHPVPRMLNTLTFLPEGLLVSLFRRFLTSSAASPLNTQKPASSAELDRMIEQMRQLANE